MTSTELNSIMHNDYHLTYTAYDPTLTKMLVAHIYNGIFLGIVWKSSPHTSRLMKDLHSAKKKSITRPVHE